MRMVFWIMISVVLIVTIYRRIIEPFLEGYRNTRKPYNAPFVQSANVRTLSTAHR